jgi:hypothetical protein
MIIGWPLPKLCPVIPTSNQDSRQAYSSNLGSFWLKIDQFWPFEEISIFSNGGHLGYRTALAERRPVSKMAAITKNRNFFKWPKLLYFKPE